MTSDDVRRFRAGDPTLFRELVERHSPRLLFLARGYAIDLDEAHDLVQETWIRAYTRRATFAGRASLLGWAAPDVLTHIAGCEVCLGRLDGIHQLRDGWRARHRFVPGLRIR